MSILADLLWAGVVYLFGGEIVVLLLIVVGLFVALALPERIVPLVSWSLIAIATLTAVVVRLTKVTWRSRASPVERLISGKN
jgi:hypothetical protein